MSQIKKINHVAIVVKDIDESLKFWETALGLKLDHIEDVPSQASKVAFIPVGEGEIELVQPTSTDSGMAAYLEKRGEGLHHVAYTVDSIQDRINELKEAGVRMIDEKPRLGAHHMNIAFLHPKSSHGVLTELCEPAK